MSLIPVFIAANRAEAQIIRNLLQEGGIESSIRTDDGGGMLPLLDFSEGVAVMVDESDREEATELLDEYAKGSASLERAEPSPDVSPDMRENEE